MAELSSDPIPSYLIEAFHQVAIGDDRLQKQTQGYVVLHLLMASRSSEWAEIGPRFELQHVPGRATLNSWENER